MGLMVTLATPSFASPRILSRYSGGGNYYYNPSHSGGPTGYSGASTPIHKQPGRVRTAAPTAALWSNRALPAPCGNYQRVRPSHCPQMGVWDRTFRTVYR